jgi:hypothetical protein
MYITLLQHCWVSDYEFGNEKVYLRSRCLRGVFDFGRHDQALEILWIASAATHPSYSMLGVLLSELPLRQIPPRVDVRLALGDHLEVFRGDRPDGLHCT